MSIDKMKPTQLITQGHYAGLTKMVNLNVIHKLICCNVADRGIYIESIDVTNFNGYLVIDMSIDEQRKDTQVLADSAPYKVESYNTIPSVSEAEFSKFLSTAMWVLIDPRVETKGE
jgi:hypothetical protein